MSLDNITMSYSDLTCQQDLDSGAFGKVSLCYHRDHGLVVLKKVFTGCKNQSENDALLEEGKIMHRLQHDRVVRLLGIILESGNYSLVIEYMEKGNLLTVLKTVDLRMSIKRRIILEIVEGMTYLHSKKVVHKDLKPENILVNDDLHVKIADLGLATLTAWSRLTKEESSRQMKSNKSSSKQKACNAGTLFYMAPEHLKSIHEKATEKSDVYSFGIVMWVIFTNKEPYEDAMNDEQIMFCVKAKERPQISDLPCDCPKEAEELMQTCWDDDPSKRPTFEACNGLFREYYTIDREQNVEDDVAAIKQIYPKPHPDIQRMQSLQADCDAEPPSIQSSGQPLSLHSSQGLHTRHSMDEKLFEAAPNSPMESEDPTEDILSRKLQDEINYHQTGSRIDNSVSYAHSQLPFQNSGIGVRHGAYGDPVNNPPLPVSPGPPRGFSARTTEELSEVSPPYRHENAMPNLRMYGSGTPQQSYIPSMPSNLNIFSQQRLVHPFNMPVLPQHDTNPHYCGPESHAQGDFQKLSVPETTVTNHYDIQQQQYGYPTDVNHAAVKFSNLSISNAKAVQIGNNNFMSIGAERPRTSRQVRSSDNGAFFRQLPPLDPAKLITEEQLQFLRDNISKKWKYFARKLGFREPDIEQIDHDYERDGLQEKVHQTLHKWQMREGSKNTTVKKVAEALHQWVKLSF
uniref:Receptor interacting serine/threonine kinase 1 n=1 Tax=Leptobrachium leishanense TaxID=445787 RepID=A0A8C5MF19_9ANUR